VKEQASKPLLKKMEASGETVPRDAFGHVRLDETKSGPVV